MAVLSGIIRRNGGTAERRNGGTAERRNGGTAERRNGGTAERRAWIPTIAIAALLALALLLAVPPAGAQTTVDYDTDDDRLIEVRNWAQLHAIRYDLNGNGDATDADYIAAFPNRDTNAATRMGCPSGMACQGYELMSDLDFDFNGDGTVNAADFDTDGSGTTDASDADNIYWNSGAGWLPIGNGVSAANRYAARFNGNSHTISNLFGTRSGYPAGAYQGLFGALAGGGRLEYVGIINANFTGNTDIGALVGESRGAVYGAYSAGGQVSGIQRIGGLVGRMLDSASLRASYSTASAAASGGQGGGLVGALHGNGTVTASYAAGAVSGSGQRGGLVGRLHSNTTSTIAIVASYAAGRVSGQGGLIGYAQQGVVNDSYCDTQASGQNNCVGGSSGDFTSTVSGYSTADLKRPTGYTGIYANWNVNVDGVAGPDDPWDFGKRRDYPLLRVDFNRDGTPTWEEFGSQYRYIPPPPSPPPYNPAHDHPEIYTNPRHEMATSCEVRTTGTGDDAKSTSTLTFDLGNYIRPLTLALSLWDGTHFRSLQSQNIAMPELRQDGQTATVEVVTDPAQTRFRLDSEYGLNLVLGYADCHTDDP